MGSAVRVHAIKTIISVKSIGSHANFLQHFSCVCSQLSQKTSFPFSEKKELWFPEYDEQTICILRADLKITDC